MSQSLSSIPIPNPINETQTDVVIIGAGPTGLTAAYQLNKAGQQTVVLEKGTRVGGIARTEVFEGYRIDIGGHRFYTKIDVVEQFWREVLGDDFLRRKRLSRIYYQQEFFHYPIQLFDTLHKLGPRESLHIGFSYLAAQCFPHSEEETFEQWVSNRFGRRLFEIFFKTYTEKVWGLPCHAIKAEWAAQRIKGLSLPVAVRNALLRPRQEEVTTLINAFDYPKLGPGMLWERVQSLLESAGHSVLLNHQAVQIEVFNTEPRFRVTSRTPAGDVCHVWASQVISSMPLPELMRTLRPAPPPPLLTQAAELTFRDFLTVALIINRPHLFPDNWLYIHSPEVHVGRIQNFGNWSAAMVPNDHSTCLGLEYFCQEGDALWEMSDSALIALAQREVDTLGLVDPETVQKGVVFRQAKAYPVYTGEYQTYLNSIRGFLAGIPGLQTAGRNGLHRYNNQDHAMLTAMLAVENILGASHNLWGVNTDRSYYEEMKIPR